MAVIESLNVILDAQVGKFEKNIDKADSHLSKFGLSSQNVLSKVSGYFQGFGIEASGLTSSIQGLGAINPVLGGIAIGAAAVTAAVTAATVAFLKFSYEAGVAAATAADDLSTAASHIAVSVTDFDLFKEVGKRVDIGAEEIEKSLIKLNKNIGEKNQATKDALKRLGLSFKDLPDNAIEATKKIADAFSKLTSETEKQNLVQDLFGKGGAELLPLLNLGSKGINDLEEHFKSLGGSLSEIDSSKINAAIEHVEELQYSMKQIGYQVAAEVSPEIIAFIEALQKAGYTGETFGVFFKTVFQGIEEMAIKATYAVEAFVDPFGTLMNTANGTTNADGLREFFNNARIASEESARLAAENAKLYASLEEIDDITLEDWYIAEQKAAKAAKDANEDIEKLTQKLYEQQLTFGMTSDEAAVYIAGLHGADEAAVRFAEDQLKIIAALEAEKKAQEETAKAAEKAAKDKIDAAKKAAEEQKKATAKILDDQISEAERLIESLMTPQEKLQSEFDKLLDLFEAGLIQEDQLQMAADKANGKANGEHKFAKALDQNNVEVFDQFNRFKASLNQDHVAIDQLMELREIKKELQKQDLPQTVIEFGTGLT